jgi:hypothetical protein
MQSLILSRLWHSLAVLTPRSILHIHFGLFFVDLCAPT